MKLSLSWLFDHIDANWQKIDVAALVSLFNKTTAEIEGFEKVTIDFKKLAAGKVIKIQDAVQVEIPEWNQTVTLSKRDDVQLNQVYVIAKDGDSYRWAQLADFASQKEGLMPALKIAVHEMKGDWKKAIPEHDVILHLDNKSVNHRPDMWGHRGVAREIAAMLKLPFKAADHLLLPHDVHRGGACNVVAKDIPIAVSIENPAACKRYAGLYFSSLEYTPSLPWMAVRLAKVDSRPLNAVVDATNYVMLDLGQPMHAFDAAALPEKMVLVRQAKNKETLALLDGQTIELTSDDCVITDGKKPIALAGIMGGKASSITPTTKTIFLESAYFDPAVIRKTAMHAKKRTESSARFEKSLDPYQNIMAIERFLKLIDEAGIAYQALAPITSACTIAGGPASLQKKITITHEYIEAMLGVSLDPQFVITTLTALDFGVDAKGGEYHIMVPPFRATKDIAIKQDIVEEIGRFYGFDAISEVLPSRQTKPFDVTPVMRMRRIKQLLSYGFSMRELYTYAFFDESFLNTINWQPGKTLKVQEAVSQNWQRLVTTLVPNMFKAVQVHANEYDVINFFEFARMWPAGTPESESSCLVGIFVDQKKAVDFYDIKQKLCILARMLGMKFDWVKADAQELQPWYLPHQTAFIMCNGVKIGTVGMVNQSFFNAIAAGDAFIFELDAHFLLHHELPIKRYTPVLKYPGIVRDVSALLPLAITVQQLRAALAALDAKIMHVALMDFFQRPEWQDQKSLTFRISMADSHATMTNEQADMIMQKVNTYLQTQGANIR